MARGGKRIGAGRPKGAATRRSQAIADKASSEGLTPLEVMLMAMRVHASKNDWDDAAAIAKDAAPYMHPRLASMQHSGPNGGPIPMMDVSKLKGMSDQELDLLERAMVQIGIVDGDPGREGGEEE